MSFLSSAYQLLVVATSSWDSIDGSLYIFERNHNSNWKKVGENIEVNVGKKGLAWGRGLHNHFSSEMKKEGDLKAPAGIFGLIKVFGDENHKIYSKSMPFLLIQEGLECIDDPSSSSYNKFVNSKFVKKDWESSEKMLEIGAPYSLGIVIGHNVNPIEKYAGSCIFMHIWKKKGLGSFGCTTMDEKDLIKVVSFLDMNKSPLLVQLPKDEYNKKIKDWQLPQLY